MRPLALAAASVFALSLAACGGGSTAGDAASAPPAAVVEPAEPEPNAVLAGCAPATGDGYCGVTFGVTPQDAKAAFPAPLVRHAGDPNVLHDPDQCFEMFTDLPAEGVSFLVENNQVGRVDVMSKGPVTSDGFGVGSTIDEIRAKYGAVLEEGPNKYEPEIIELTVPQGAGKVLFEIQDGAVRAWRAGVAPLVDYVERCG